MADAIINVAIGVLLLVFPRGLVEALGLPLPPSAFYPSILGAVLIGIGVALVIEHSHGRGLGIRGALVINLSGAVVLGLWLLFGGLLLPVRGQLLLWGLVVVLLALGILEVAHWTDVE